MQDGHELSIRDQIIKDYRPDLEKLLVFLPYFDAKTAKDVQKSYDADGKLQSIPVPVYDSTLLNFVKVVKTTKFMYRNYPYVYTRLHIDSPEREREVIRNARIRDIDIFRAVLSRYIHGGQTKAYLWSQGVEERIYVEVIDGLQKKFAEYELELVGKGLKQKTDI